MARDSSDTPRTVPLEIEVKLAEPATAQRQPPVAAYAFARSGQLIDKIAIDASGHARMHLPDLRVMQEVRILVGPNTPAEQSTVSELSRRGAKEQFVRVSTAREPPVLQFEVQPALCATWLRRCLVHGTLHRRELRKNRRVDTPVRDASVQMWEIEPAELMIAKLPNAVIEDFRDLLLDAAGKRKRVAPGASRADPAPAQRASLRATRLQSTKPLITAQMRDLESTPHFARLISLAEHTAADLREHLVQAAGAVRLLLCLLYPAWIRKQMLANAITDADGRFQAWVFPSSHCPDLNLYFTASAAYRGASVPVYDPKPVASFTYWDYQAGTEIALLATSAPSGVPTESLIRDAARTPSRVIAAESV
jgi:hypothetical protein